MEDNEKILLSPDALIAMVVTELEAREMAELSALEQEGKNYNPSDKFLRRMDRLRKEVAKKKQKAKLIAIAKRTLITFSILISVFTLSMLPVQAVRQTVISTLISWHDHFISIIFSTDEKIPSNSKLSTQTIKLAYIPSGFELVSLKVEDESYFAYYQNQNMEKQWFTFSVLPINATQEFALDNENAEYYSLEINEQSVLWAAFDDGSNSLLWENNGWGLQLVSNMDLSLLINIFTGISFNK